MLLYATGLVSSLHTPRDEGRPHAEHGHGGCPIFLKIFKHCIDDKHENKPDDDEHHGHSGEHHGDGPHNGGGGDGGGVNNGGDGGSKPSGTPSDKPTNSPPSPITSTIPQGGQSSMHTPL